MRNKKATATVPKTVVTPGVTHSFGAWDNLGNRRCSHCGATNEKNEQGEYLVECKRTVIPDLGYFFR